MRIKTTIALCSVALATVVIPARAQSPMVFAATQTAVSCRVTLDGQRQACAPLIRYFLGRNNQEFMAFELQSSAPGQSAVLLAGPASQSPDPARATTPISVITLHGSVMPAAGTCSVQRHPLRPNGRGGWYMTINSVTCSVVAQGRRLRIEAQGDGTESQFEDL